MVLHELEAWVFAGPASLEPWMFDDDAGIGTEVGKIAAAHVTPEDIDEGVRTAPSKRSDPRDLSALARWLARLEALAA